MKNLDEERGNLPLMVFGLVLAAVTIVATCGWIFVEHLGPWIVAWAPWSYVVLFIALMLVVVLVS